MVLLGLSILIASVTFICYRRTSFFASSSFLQWFRRPSPSIAPAVELDDVAKEPQDDESSHAIATLAPTIEKPALELKTEEMKRKEPPTRAEVDRKAMPPPPPFRKPSSPTTPRASASTKTASTTASIPSFNLAPSPPKVSALEPQDEEDERDNLPPPSFPALNSAQRAQAPRLNATPSQPRNQSLGLMPPPSRSLPLPNRGPPSSSSLSAPPTGLAPPPTHSAIPPKPKKRVLLKPGHSPLDWARLTSSREFLASQPPKLLRVPPSLLKLHNGRRRKIVTPDGEQTYVTAEAWTILGGKVYNMTPYLPYHPGGEPELLRVAGKDGTRLFGEIHPWVNYEGMLEGCLVGIAVDESEAEGKEKEKSGAVGSGLDDMD